MCSGSINEKFIIIYVEVEMGLVQPQNGGLFAHMLNNVRKMCVLPYWTIHHSVHVLVIIGETYISDRESHHT